MATTKKPATKKPVSKAATAKKTPAKKAVATKTTAKKAPAKATKQDSTGYRSFKVSTPTQSFTTFKITRQTVYWVILIAFIIFVQLWILKLQIEVTSLLETQQTELMNEL